MIIKIEIPEALPEGHGASYKKGISEVLLESALTPLDYTPVGHERSRELGMKLGAVLVEEITKVVKSADQGNR